MAEKVTIEVEADIKGAIDSIGKIEEGVKALDDPKVLQADTIANNINKTLEDAGSKSRLKFTLAEALDDPDLLATQAAFENTRRLGKLKEFESKYSDAKSVPRPPHWSGWRVLPREVEFWLDGEGRIHERLVYYKENDKWT